MIKKYLPAFLFIVVLIVAFGCKAKIKQQEDEVYSRHLQRQVKLSIISTPMPDDKSELNLLLLNDGQDLEKLHVKEITDSLYRKKLIKPLIIVGIIAGDVTKEYGVSEMPDYKKRGDKADKYAAFIHNELYAFVKKKAGVRKFKSVVIAGGALGGLSAFDIAWNHADKIDKVGVFTGYFHWSDKDVLAADYSFEKNRIIINKIRSSRKKPHLKYWFYTTEKGDKKIGLNKNGIVDVVEDTKDLVELIKSKNVCMPEDVVYIEEAEEAEYHSSWSHQLPAFLLWAFGK